MNHISEGHFMFEMCLMFAHPIIPSKGNYDTDHVVVPSELFVEVFSLVGHSVVSL